MGLMAVQAGQLCLVGRFLAGHGLYHLEVAFDAILLRQCQWLYLGMCQSTNPRGQENYQKTSQRLPFHPSFPLGL